MAFWEVEDLELGAFHVEVCTDSWDFVSSKNNGMVFDVLCPRLSMWLAPWLPSYNNKLQVFRANGVTTTLLGGVGNFLSCMWASFQAQIGHHILVVPSVTRKGPLKKKEEKKHTHTHTHNIFHVLTS